MYRGQSVSKTKQDTKHLTQRGSLTWYLVVRKPAFLGGKIIVQSLKTRDLKEAQQRRNIALGDLERAWAAHRTAAPEWTTPAGILAVGAAVAAEVALGRVRPGDALEGFDLEAWHRARDSDPNGLTFPPDLAPAMAEARALLTGEPLPLALSAAVASHLADLAHARPSTVRTRCRRLNALVEALKDPPLASVTRADLAGFVRSHVTAADLAPKTKKAFVVDLRVFFRWAKASGLLDADPSENLTKLVRDTTRGVTNPAAVRAWTDSELSQLLNKMREELPPDDYMFTLVHVALYSGMRAEEVCNIRGSDIVDNCFVIREAKNKNSLRSVPVHSALACYVTGLGADEYLIPGLTPAGVDNKRSRPASNRFSRYKTVWGFDTSLNLHCMRKSFITKLEAAGVPQSVAESLAGHARKSLSYGMYSNGAGFAVLREAVEKVQYKIF